MTQPTYDYNYNDVITITSGTGISDINMSNISGPSISTGIYTPNGTSASPYNFNYNWTTTTGTPTDTITIADFGNIMPSTLDVRGDANFEGDVKIKGKSLVESLEKIEEKLAILRPNEQLEEKWDQLRELRRQYMELEKDIIEKEKIWDILKK